MRLIKLTRTLPSGVAVYINPMNIAAIDNLGNLTRVLINAPDKDGGLISIGVIEQAHIVAEMLITQ